MTLYTSADDVRNQLEACNAHLQFQQKKERRSLPPTFQDAFPRGSSSESRATHPVDTKRHAQRARAPADHQNMRWLQRLLRIVHKGLAVCGAFGKTWTVPRGKGAACSTQGFG